MTNMDFTRFLILCAFTLCKFGSIGAKPQAEPDVFDYDLDPTDDYKTDSGKQPALYKETTKDWDYLSPSTTYYPAGHVEDLVQDTSLHSNILEHAQLRLQLRNLQDQIWAKVDMLDYRISNSINDELDRISKIILENKKNIKNGTRKHDENVQILDVEIENGFLSASKSKDLLMNDVEDLRHTNTINKSQMDLEIRMDKEKAGGEMQSQSETVDTIITMMKIVPKLANPYTALGAASDLAIQTALNAVKGVGGGSGKSTGKKG